MWPIFTLLIAMFSIQGGASLAKQLFSVLGPEGTTALRIFFAALILVSIWRPWRRRLKPVEIRAVCFYGVALGVMNLTFYLALQRIPLGIAVALEFTGPLSLALWSSRRRLDFLWAFLAVTGILLILPLPSSPAAVDPVGILFALAAGGCWALYILAGQKISSAMHGGIASAYGMSVAALVAMPFGVASAGGELLNLSVLPLALAVAVFSSAIPYSLEMIALRSLPTKTFGILMSLEPAVAALCGFVFLAERLSVLQWFAIACVMAASAGSAWTARRS